MESIRLCLTTSAFGQTTFGVSRPKHEEPFSTPRSWHMLSDALHNIGAEPSDEQVEVLAFGCLTPAHATQFKAFIEAVPPALWSERDSQGRENLAGRAGGPGRPVLPGAVLSRPPDKGTPSRAVRLSHQRSNN